jgi:hypothetical protein
MTLRFKVHELVFMRIVIFSLSSACLRNEANSHPVREKYLAIPVTGK